MKKPIRLLLVIIVVAVAQPQAEEIQLKDGSKVTGKVTGVNGDTFLVKTNYGEINVPRTDILSINFPENTPKTANGDVPPAMDEELKGDIYTNRTVGFKIAVPKGWKMATYKVLAETQYQKNFSGYVKDGETEAQLDGHKGIRMVWHGTSNANQAAVKFLVYILPYDGKMIRLSFFTLSPLFDDAVLTFEKIAASYQSTAGKN